MLTNPTNRECENPSSLSPILFELEHINALLNVCRSTGYELSNKLEPVLLPDEVNDKLVSTNKDSLYLKGETENSFAPPLAFLLRDIKFQLTNICENNLRVLGRIAI